MIVQHNMISNNGQRNLEITSGTKEKSVEKLSSGYKINRAADDAAGLTISEKMRWQIRGLSRASDNAQDGISLLQTADGALNEVQAIIQRMRELSVQGANDTNTMADRTAIQSEMDKLTTEIDRIADDTEFNTMKLLDGSMESAASPNIGNGVQASPINYTVLDSGVQQFIDSIVTNPVVSGSGVNSAQEAKMNTVLQDSIVPQAVKSLIAAFPVFGDAVANGQISNQIGLNLYCDTSSTTLAYVSIKYGHYTSGPDTGKFADSSIALNLSVNTATLGLDSAGNMSEDNRTALETTIVHEMMHAFMDDLVTNGMIGGTDGKIDASNKFPDWFAEGMAQTVAGGCANVNDWVNGGMRLTETSTEADISSVIKASGNALSSGSTQSQYGTGYLACMYLGYLAAGKPSTLSASNLASGLNTVLKRIADGDSLSDVINTISGGAYTSVSDFQTKFGDNASAQFVSTLLKAAGTTGNGSVVKSLTASDLLDNANTTSGVYAVDATSEYVTSSVGGNRNWGSGGGTKTGTNATGSSGSGTGGTSGSGGTGGTGGTGGSGGTGGTGGSGGTGGTGVIVGTGFHLQVGSLGYQAVMINIKDTHTKSLALDGISVTSYELAGAAMEACDKALASVSENRSQIGAYINRLEHTIANLDNNSENTQAAESQIRDTDMAEEMVEYSKHNILEQMGQSLLAQSNQSQQGVLNLLQ